jgi:peptidoglycan hydrolase-like protein with peptidoglycan-binding domain
MLFTTCLACSPRGGCSEAKISGTDTTSIRASVGAGGANRPDDVSVIQSALNDIPAAKGGADPQLKVDGISGPLTRAAILRFQRGHARIIDGRVDPVGGTITALEVELDAAGADVVTAPRPGGATGRRKRSQTRQAPNLDIVSKVVDLLPKIKVAIRAANFHMLSANPFVTNQKLVTPKDPFKANVRLSLNLLETVFSLSKFNNPRPAFDNIRRVYKNMEIALNRTFETAPLASKILFVPNTFVAMEAEAAAYTSEGGAFLDSKSRFKDLGEIPANQIYICNSFLKFNSEIDQVATIVHELAHYVSGQPIKIDDIVKEGHMLTAAEKPKFDAIRPDQKIRSAEHYAFFAVLAGVRRL